MAAIVAQGAAIGESEAEAMAQFHLHLNLSRTVAGG